MCPKVAKLLESINSIINNSNSRPNTIIFNFDGNGSYEMFEQ